MSEGNKVKSEQLGMSFGKAANRLRKKILFELVQETDRDICFKCGKRIKSIDDLSVEHKQPWLHSNHPKELFFDLSNIAFSHTFCNVREQRNFGVRGAIKYKGVRYDKRYKKSPYFTKIWLKENGSGSYVYIGSYRTAEEAALAYDSHAIKHYGAGAVTNKSLGLLD